MNPYIRVRIGLRLGLAAVFAFAAITKICSGGSIIANSTVYTDWSQAVGIRLSIICAETLLVFWLVSGVESNAAGFVALILLSAFTGALLLELTKDHPKPCGCMGPQTTLNAHQALVSLWLDLVRNALMMIGGAWLYLAPGPDLQSPPIGTGHLAPMPATDL